MTESRENVRRRQWKDRAQIVAPSDVVPLPALCIIVGCLRLRVGANLCRAHDQESSP